MDDIFDRLVTKILWKILEFIYKEKIHAMPLDEETAKTIKEKGIRHCTNTKGYNGIMESKRIKGCQSYKAYSDNFNSYSSFYLNDGTNLNSNIVNSSLKFKRCITIMHLSGEQISKLKMREYDKAILCPEDFIFDKDNIVKETELQKLNYAVFGIIVTAAIIVAIAVAFIRI